MAAAPVAWVPWGALEFHAEHLPYGTDGFTAHAILERAAQQVGGIVLPWTALTIGTLHFEWTLRYGKDLVESALRQTLEQLAAFGARVVVVHTGHGPLDLDHLIKRVCAESRPAPTPLPGFRAYGLCYLELNAALGTGLGTEWPAAVDHGSILETSWMMALEPELVHLERLPEDSAAADIVGIYGPNPRTRADADVATAQDPSGREPAGRSRGWPPRRESIDAMQDLRTFVERYWPEPLVLAGRAGSQAKPRCLSPIRGRCHAT